MCQEISPNRISFPWWVVAGAFLLSAAYLPTLTHPFDFLDDGNLVYPTEGLSFLGHFELWWEKVQANMDHLGPWRPTLWIHWELFANLFDANPVLWRIERWLWCALAAGTFLWLLHELGIPPVAALLSGAIGMWNPYRSEIWLSLTLAEGVAMPYALIALIAARRGAFSSRPWAWDILSALCVLIALGCKNTFAAIVPAQVLLRLWPDNLYLQVAWKRNGFRALLLSITLLMPLAHFCYFSFNWHEGQYRPGSPNLTQLIRLGKALKGAIGAEYLALGVIVAAGAVVRDLTQQGWLKTRLFLSKYRATILCALTLLIFGVAVYLPFNMVSGRYTIPAIWGIDLLLATLFSALLGCSSSRLRWIAWFSLALGLIALMLALMLKEEKAASRSRMLWAALQYIEQNAPFDARIAWFDGNFDRGEIDAEEGIHFAWHLFHRGRSDIRIGLFNADGSPLSRVELGPLDRKPEYRISSTAAAGGWMPEQKFQQGYRFGHRSHQLVIERRPPLELSQPPDPQWMPWIRIALFKHDDPRVQDIPGGHPDR